MFSTYLPILAAILVCYGGYLAMFRHEAKLGGALIVTGFIVFMGYPTFLKAEETAFPKPIASETPITIINTDFSPGGFLRSNFTTLTTSAGTFTFQGWVDVRTEPKVVLIRYEDDTEELCFVTDTDRDCRYLYG